MFRNYLTVALRNIAKHRLYSFINIAGLAVGLASAILILLFVRDEISHDKWIEGFDDIYRVNVTFYPPGRDPIAIAPAMFPLADAMKADIPEVQAAVRLGQQSSAVRFGDRQFFEDVMATDADFFEVVRLPLLKGDPASVLSRPDTAVISESLARKYFGDMNPIGKILMLDEDKPVQVSGIMKDLPHNTSFKAEFLIPIRSKADRHEFEYQRPRWTSANWHTFARLAPGTDPARVEAAILEVFNKNIDPMKELGIPVKAEALVKAQLTPLANVHLEPRYSGTMKPPGDWTTIYGFSAVAALVLLIACINFMNLATARATQRAREVSMRKVVGAKRSQLVVQLLGESVLLSLFALALALAIVEMLQPFYGQFLDRPIELDYLRDWDATLGVVAMAVLTGLFGGLYPAVVLSGFRPASVLKANRSGQSGSGTLRAGLVIVQFAISIALGITTAVVYAQVLYARNFDTGLNRENVVILTGIGRDQVAPVYETLRNELLANPDILGVAGSNNEPYSQNENNTLLYAPANPTEAVVIRSQNVEPEFLELYGLRVIAGRALSRDRGEDLHDEPFDEDPNFVPAEGRSILITRSAVRRLGFGSPEEAVGKTVREPYNQENNITTRKIVGVVSDVNFDTLRMPSQPTIFYHNPHGMNHFSIRVAAGKTKEAVAFIDETWKRLVPSLPVRRNFLEDTFNELYVQDEKRGQMFAFFAGVAIFIACLGLYGLASFTAERRTKEIGIRKVFGARVRDIVRLLVWQFSQPVLIANLIAWPIAWYYLRDWLNGFAYRIELSPLYFIAAGVAALLIAWVTVTAHATRVARSKPVNALRYE